MHENEKSDRTPNLPRVGSVLAGRYSLEALISQGAFGAVYRAQDSYLGQPVALKLLSWKRELEVVEAFQKALSSLRDEARASVRLSHPNIARVYNYERDLSLEFLVMEFVDGQDLREALRAASQGRLPIADVVAAGLAVAEGLAHAHQHGLLHLDVKPANVLRRRDGRIKLCDFGLSSLTGLLRASEGTFALGTLPYMSPEALRGAADLDERADIYSLAATLYELGEGQPPFGRGRPAAEGHLHKPVPKPTHLPASMGAVLIKALAKRPADRFHSIRAFADALAAAAEAPRPPEPLEPPAPSRRRPQPVQRTPTTMDRKTSLQTTRLTWDLDTGTWSGDLPTQLDGPTTLVTAFCARELDAEPKALRELVRKFPRSIVIGCSTSGEIHGDELRDRSVSLAVTRFESTKLASSSVIVRDAARTRACGLALAKKLAAPDLKAVYVLAGGMQINGSELATALSEGLGPSVVVTGGLAGDGDRFEKTWAMSGSFISEGVVVGVGLYGDNLRVGHGSVGGWDPFGPVRRITRSEGNVVYEIDGQPALALYEQYLGDQAAGLPATGLLFPLTIRPTADDRDPVTRTLLAVDRDQQSLTFAGDVPQGWVAQMMKADFDRLVDGASSAAGDAAIPIEAVEGPVTALAVSCVGRRLILGDRTEDELEAVQALLPEGSVLAGFYSYGELSPLTDAGPCALHNQTMTLTVFSEVPVHASRSVEDDPTMVTSKKLQALLDPAAPAGARRGNKAPTKPTPPRIKAPPRAPVATTPAAAKPRPAKIPPPPPPPPPPSPAADTGTLPLKVERFRWDAASGQWSTPSFPKLDSESTLVVAFGAPELLRSPTAVNELVRAFPKSCVIGCSSSGEIHGDEVADGSLSVLAIRFRNTRLIQTSVDVQSPAQSFAAGQTLARRLGRDGLRWVFVLSEGLAVNGSELVRGLNSTLPDGVVCTGGLAGDGDRFEQTWVLSGGKMRSGQVAAVGLYGDHLVVGHGSKGGWDAFGSERRVTRSEANVVFELDGQPALQLYEQYLGDQAADLPASGLLFPLAVRSASEPNKVLVRTLLGIDREASSLTFAGDIAEGATVQLMKADFDRLVEGASGATGTATARLEQLEQLEGPLAAIAISCVGRRLVLGDRTEDELEAISTLLPAGTPVAGFYSYGELSPFASSSRCDLHNQTMTLTVFGESPTALTRPAQPSTVAGPIDVPEPAPAPPPPTPFAAPAPMNAAPTTRIELEPVPEVTLPPGSPVTGLGLDVVERNLDDVTVLTLHGRISEAFRGIDVANRLGGTALLDLGGVNRVTSFGVREWLQMLKTASARVTSLYFARCSDAIVNQINMIRPFVGEATILSIYAPLRCETCGLESRRLLDCHDDAARFDGREPIDDACRGCGGRAQLDDDPASFLATAKQHVGRRVPARVRGIAAALERGTARGGPSLPRVEKTLDDAGTTIIVRGKLDATIRWRRVFDGVEGDMTVDLSAVGEADVVGIHGLAAALTGLDPAVDRILVRGASPLIADELGPRVGPRVQLGDALPPAGPRDSRPAVPTPQPPPMQSMSPNAQRPWFSAALGAVVATTVLGGALYATSRSSADETEGAATKERVVAPAQVVAAGMLPSEPAGAPSPSVPKADAPSDAIDPSAVTEPPDPADEGLPPPWTEVPYRPTPEGVEFVGRAEGSEHRDELLVSARNAALVELARRLDDPGTVLHDLIRAKVDPSAEVTEAQAQRVAEYLERRTELGAPTRKSVFFRERGGQTVVFARYVLSSKDLEAYRSAFVTKSTVRGATVAAVPPMMAAALEDPSGVVVLDVRHGSPMARLPIRPGDRILAVNGHHCDDVETFQAVLAREWDATKKGRLIEFSLDLGGVEKPFSMRRPR